MLVLSSYSSGHPDITPHILFLWNYDCFIYLYLAVEWVTSQGQMALVTSPVSVIYSGLSHMSGVVTRAQFTVALVNGLGANLTDASRQLFIKQVSD